VITLINNHVLLQYTSGKPPSIPPTVRVARCGYMRIHRHRMSGNFARIVYYLWCGAMVCRPPQRPGSVKNIQTLAKLSDL